MVPGYDPSKFNVKDVPPTQKEFTLPNVKEVKLPEVRLQGPQISYTKPGEDETIDPYGGVIQ